LVLPYDSFLFINNYLTDLDVTKMLIRISLLISLLEIILVKLMY
jgi:hypothetical protein